MKFDITQVKEEIEKKKKEKTQRAEILGEKTGVPFTSDKFLAELVYSRNSGEKTGASVKVATVAKVADAKVKGKAVNTQVITEELMQHATKKPVTNQVKKVPNNMGIDQKLEEKRRIAEMANNMQHGERDFPNQTMSDALSQYQNAKYVGAPMNGYLNEYQAREAMAHKGLQPMGTPNTTLIVEQVNNVAQQFLDENFGSLFSDALKQTIVEQYKAERVKAAIQENRELIKEIVVETILELQKRSQNSKKV